MKNVVVATAVGVRMTELGAFELVVKDPDGQTHTVVFSPLYRAGAARSMAKKRASSRGSMGG